MNVPIMHLIYPGMTQSVPVIVTEPSIPHDYVWVIRVSNGEEFDVHTSRLSSDPVGQLSDR